jgi:hypothetical protein
MVKQTKTRTMYDVLFSWGSEPRDEVDDPYPTGFHAITLVVATDRPAAVEGRTRPPTFELAAKLMPSPLM